MRACPTGRAAAAAVPDRSSAPSSVRAVTPATTPAASSVTMASSVVDRLAAVLAPQLGKRLAFDLAAEQRADARAGEAEPELIDEIRRQHEGVAERVADLGRIDVGARRAPGGCRVSCSSNRTRPAWIDVSWTPPVPSRDGAGASLSPTGTSAPAFRRDVIGGAGAVPRRRGQGRSAAPRVSVKIAIALPAAQSAARIAVEPSTAAYRRAKALLFYCRRMLAVGRPSGVTHAFRPALGPL